MSIAAINFKNFLEEKNLRCNYMEATEDRNEIITIGAGGDNAKEIELVFFFDGDGDSVNVKSFSIARVPADRLMDMYVKLNELNYEYRWVKFYLDKDNEVTVSGDAIINPDSAAEECFEILLRYHNIIDEVYPQLMKVIYA